MSTGAFGMDEAVAEQLVKRLTPGSIRKAASLLIRRPGRERTSLGCNDASCVPVAPEQNVIEEEYTPGAIGRMTKTAEEVPRRPMEVTVRTGREAIGKLPDPPEMMDRIYQEKNLVGAINKLLLKAPPFHGFTEKTADVSDSIVSALSAQQQAEESQEDSRPFGGFSDYVTKGLMGTGVGKTLGFLLRGRGISEATERKLGIGGAMGGVGLTAWGHMAAKEKTREHRRAALLKAMEEVEKAHERAESAFPEDE